MQKRRDRVEQWRKDKDAKEKEAAAAKVAAANDLGVPKQWNLENDDDDDEEDLTTVPAVKTGEV